MLAIAGGKGGCGKTTTTLGLAAAFDGPVLAVDADVDMPNLHSLAGVPRDPPTDRAGYAHPDHDDVTVRPAPTRTGERGARRCDDPGARLARIRASVGADETMLVDCPAGAGPTAAAPLREADGVVLVASACAPSLRDAVKTGAMAETLGTTVLGAVITRARVAPSGVASVLGCPVLGAVPPTDPPVLDAERVRSAYLNVADCLHSCKEL